MISVIVPIYNTEKYLHRCIVSILNQTFTDFELLLVNDGSTDKSGEICDEYAKKDSRICVFHKENGGVSSARNMGLLNAKGEWIAFCDSDDWLDDNFLNNLLYVANDKTDLVIGEMQYSYIGNNVKTDNSTVKLDKFIYLRKMFVSGFTSVFNILYRREFIENINLKFEPIRYSEDFIFSVKAICLASQIEYAKDAVYHYDRTNENSALHNYPKDLYKDLLYCDNMMVNFFYGQGLLDKLKPEIYWRVLRNKKELVLSVKLHNEFRQAIPDANDYILSCPVINVKIKIMMWLLSHHLDFIVRFFIYIRKVLRR